MTLVIGNSKRGWMKGFKLHKKMTKKWTTTLSLHPITLSFLSGTVT